MKSIRRMKVKLQETIKPRIFFRWPCRTIHAKKKVWSMCSEPLTLSTWLNCLSNCLSADMCFYKRLSDNLVQYSMSFYIGSSCPRTLVQWLSICVSANIYIFSRLWVKCKLITCSVGFPLGLGLWVFGWRIFGDFSWLFERTVLLLP